jgi:hypothetical protein
MTRRKLSPTINHALHGDTISVGETIVKDRGNCYTILNILAQRTQPEDRLSYPEHKKAPLGACKFQFFSLVKGGVRITDGVRRPRLTLWGIVIQFLPTGRSLCPLATACGLIELPPLFGRQDVSHGELLLVPNLPHSILRSP